MVVPASTSGADPELAAGCGQQPRAANLPGEVPTPCDMGRADGGCPQNRHDRGLLDYHGPLRLVWEAYPSLGPTPPPKEL